MTDRLYYTDAYTTTFNATVAALAEFNGQPAVILDRSYFYPASGGQPHDTGLIDDRPVLDVLVREADGAVLHILAKNGDLAQGSSVHGQINWARRFDHMQHHTGQHILTQAFIQAAGAETVGFHLGEQSVTIDLDRQGLTPGQIDAAEDLANAIVTADLPVDVSFPPPEAVAALPLRKLPDVSGKLRVISIGEFDVTACGGTHVARTGEIGLIKVIRSEKYKDMTRVEFRCGGRALRDYREKNALLLGLAADLTVGYWELGEAVERLKVEGKQLRADLRAARQAMLDGVADSWWHESEAGPDAVRIVRRVLLPGEYDAGELRVLASKLVERQGAVVLLGLAGEKANLILARHAELPGPDMVEALQRAVGTITGEANARRGGGRPDFAQGGGFAADAAALEAALAAAEAFVRAALA